MGKAIVDILDLKHVAVIILDKTPPADLDSCNDVLYKKCNVADYYEVQAVAEAIRQEVRMLSNISIFTDPDNTNQKIGEPTILINNAGVVVGKSLLDLSKDEISKSVKDLPKRYPC